MKLKVIDIEGKKDEDIEIYYKILQFKVRIITTI